MKRRVVLAAMLMLAISRLPSGVCEAAETRLSFGEIYSSFGVLGLQFSEKTKALAGKRVAIRGFIAPPLKAEADFFVLTREPVALCPFCQSDADWPADIVVVYPKGNRRITSYEERVEVFGTLEVGSKTDPRTGFVSLLRLVDADWRRR
ncbi:MAG: hypothetical protein A4E57_00794 [Syntrophorhabdaceae bacterium PtaU1.Bin034]|jgi:hypothetical protein|nr:MAG: hypothetical protein A4E57_00794 [Syntrophorhabdaceae bacterium PtaU1.Bin034]